MTIQEIAGDYPVLKMHGCGNDFIVLPDFNEKIIPGQVRALCSRHFGVGADGLITIVNSRIDRVPWRMKFFNPDGSIAEMCGNGIRCFVKYLFDHGLISETGAVPVDTDAGIITPEIIKNADREALVRVNMGIPGLYNQSQVTLSPGERGIVQGNASGHDFTFVSMGNPHAVIFSGQPEKDVIQSGPLIENNKALFPQKTNVEFVKVISAERLQMHVWERGAGVTLACGTGACAGFVAAVLNGHSRSSATVQLPGGNLMISWEGPGEPVFMTGNATNVFEIESSSLDRYLSGQKN
ncbi:MAG: diaminopimelate epimerase [Spirochaetales bacterium]|nr:diaminopimelate epimerase [Spirochaetales bacterium]